MSITDELRECMSQCISDDWLIITKSAFEKVADRIDTEYQKAIRELNDLADASVLLPVDADDEIIHVGDMMERGEARGHVIALMLSKYPKKWGGLLHWGVQLEGEQAPTALDAYFRHYHEPTVEDVLRQFLGECESAQNLGYDEVPQEVFAEYAKRLKLAGESE